MVLEERIRRAEKQKKKERRGQLAEKLRRSPDGKSAPFERKNRRLIKEVGADNQN
ncbi:MAG: hypothetical protein U9O78_03325 [Patescibacteria group bacterium]|nr:hypothetical protein [Patescibacteria group bacterium]